MPARRTETKKVVVALAGDPDDKLYEIDVEPGATAESVFDAMGLQKGTDGKFAYQLSKPGSSSGVFGDKENIFPSFRGGEKLKVVPKTEVALY